MNEIYEESKKIIDEVSEKYGYSITDEPGNDSLRTVLLKAVPIMLKDTDGEERKLFFDMLQHTPIEITENLTQEKYDELEKKYIGNPNPHIPGRATHEVFSNSSRRDNQ